MPFRIAFKRLLSFTFLAGREDEPPGACGGVPRTATGPPL